MGYGGATFDTIKIPAVFVGGGGDDVAVDKESGARIPMKVGTAGLGANLGVKDDRAVPR